MEPPRTDVPGVSHATDDALAELAGRSFESIVEELEEVARSMDRGDLGVEAVTDLYVRARLLHRAASARLDAVRARLESVVADADG